MQSQDPRSNAPLRQKTTRTTLSRISHGQQNCWTIKKALATTGKDTARGETTIGTDDSDIDEQEVADDFEELMKALDDNRMVCAVEMAGNTDEEPDFTTKTLGGPSTFAKKGVWNDAVQGGARSGVALDFCQRRNVQTAMRFEISLYGLAHANILARAFAHRQQFMFDWELMQPGGARAPWGIDCWREYEGTAAFKAFASSPDLPAATIAAVSKVRRAGPDRR